MACLDPRVFRNPSQHYVPGIDQALITCPCGECLGCQVDKQNEWIVRSYYEFRDSQLRKGSTLFFTLTYNDDNLPTFAKNAGFPVVGSCFDYNHIKTFIHSLRKSIKDKYQLNKDSFKYLICCEYGSVTKRPHYHGLLHTKNGIIDPLWLMSKIRDLWHYGFVWPRSGNFESAIVTDFKPTQYVSKYICKDIDFFGQPHIKQLLYDDSGQKNILVKRKLKRYLPTHYQSKGYGSFLIDIILKNNLPFDIIDNGIRPLLQQHVYRVPRYILNRLCYNYCPQFDSVTGELLRDENGKIKYLRYLNDFGKKFKLHKLENNVNELAKRLEHDLSFDGLKTFLDDSDVKAITLNPNGSVSDIYMRLNEYKGNHSYRDIAIYCLCGRGRELPYSELLPLVNLSSPDSLFKYVLLHFRDFQSVDCQALPFNEVPTSPIERRITLDSLPYFQGMNAMLQIYNTFKIFNMKRGFEAQRIKQRFISIIRNLFKPH